MRHHLVRLEVMESALSTTATVQHAAIFSPTRPERWARARAWALAMLAMLAMWNFYGSWWENPRANPQKPMFSPRNMQDLWHFTKKNGGWKKRMSYLLRFDDVNFGVC